MGYTAGFFLAHKDEAPPLGEHWRDGDGQSDGWVVWFGDPDVAGIPSEWADLRGPVLHGAVFDDDYGVLDAWYGGVLAWQWIVNPEVAARAYDVGHVLNIDDAEADDAANRGAVVPAILDWADRSGLPAADSARLDAILAHGYPLAQDGVFAVLREIGVLQAAELTEKPEPVQEIFDQLLNAGGFALVPPHLVELLREAAALLDAGKPVPDEVKAALLEFGAGLKATPDAVTKKQASAPRTPLPAPPQPAVMAFEVDTYENLLTRGSDVADWVEEVRDRIVLPVAALAGERLSTWSRIRGENGLPNGMEMSLWLTTRKGRSHALRADSRGWSTVLRRLRDADATAIELELRPLNEDARNLGEPGLSVHVDAGWAGADSDGPDEGMHPAQFVVTISRPMLDAALPEGRQLLVDLTKQTAIRFGAVTGYVTADRTGTVGGFYEYLGTPWETRMRVDTTARRRLDRAIRGVHWGNLISENHVAAIGGAERLRDSGLFHVVEELANSTPRLWWLQLTADVFAPEIEEADRAAELLRPILPPYTPRRSGAQ